MADSRSIGALAPTEKRYLLGASIAVVTAGLVLVLGLTFGPRARGWWRGENDIHGTWTYRAAQTVDADLVASLDLERVHAELFPRWVVAAARAHRSYASPTAEPEAFEELRRAVEGDANLTAIVEELRAIVLAREELGRAERLRYLTWAWSTYLDRASQPYRLSGGVGVSRSERNGFFYVIAYRTLADLEVSVAGEPQRVRLMGRVDHTTLRERHLGGTSETDEGAIVVADRLEEFAVDAVWPILGARQAATTDDLEAVEAAFAESIAREAADALAPADFEALAATAASRARLLAVMDSIAARESCSRFAYADTPITGHDRLRLLRFAYYSIVTEGAPCPLVKLEEVTELVKHSEALATEPGLETAVAGLVAWVARTVAVHEARHVADQAAGGIDELHCPGCGPPSVAAEASAYLASFAWAPAPVTAYYQACRAVRSGTNPHAAAMEAIQQHLGNECLQGPPVELALRSRALEQELFGRSQPIRLPDDFPLRLALPGSPSFRRANQRLAER